MKALIVKDIRKDFRGHQVINGVSFSLELGERRALIGPNGAGKTTLFNIISGMIRPSAGEIFIFDQNVTRTTPYHRSRIGLARTFQKNNLFFNLSLQENIRLALLINNKQVEVKHFLKEWDFWRKRKMIVGELSYGEQRQVELLLALAQAPRLILLDEPTAGMSTQETEMITRMIADLSREIAVLIIEHDMEVVFNLADKITVIYQGKILCEGNQEEVRSNAQVQEVYLGEPAKEVRW